MAINGFGGAPGSGKTYGVIEHVILPAIAKGRFVLTNIEGLDTEAIYQYVVDNSQNGKIFCIGHIRTCDRNAPEIGDFFPGQDALDKPMPIPAADYPMVCGGDLVVIDEATRYWPTGEKVKPAHAYFFREHRHFANELGHTCDMVVIDPDLTMLARALRGKIEMSSVTHKPKSIGLNRYVVNIYSRGRVNGKATQTLGPYGFKKEIYSLYKSYSHENAKEQAVDGRQNIFKNPRMWMFLGGLLLMGGFSVWSMLNFFSGKGSKDAKTNVANSSVTAFSNPSTPSGTSVPQVSSIARQTDVLRIAGEVIINGERWIAVSDSMGRLRYENPALFVGRGVFLVGNVDGQRVTTWSGGLPSRQSVSGSVK